MVLSRASPFRKMSQFVMPDVSIPPPNLQHEQPFNPQTGDLFVQTTTATGQVYYFNAKTRVSTWERPQNACIISQATWEIVQTNITQGFKTEIERLSAAEVPQAQTSVQQNVAVDSDTKNNIDESEEAVVEHPPKKIKVTEWVKHISPDGKICNHNSHTKESVWVKPQAMLDLEERLGTVRASHAQTNVQRNAALDVKINTLDSTGESKEKVVEEMKKQPEVVEEKKVESKPEQKPVKKSRPVASTPIPGTVWIDIIAAADSSRCVVRTNDGKCFFYDLSKRRSVWKRPEELKNRPDVDKLLSTKPEVKTEKVEVRNVQEEPSSKKIRSEVEVKEIKEESNHEVTQPVVLGEEAAITPGVQASQHMSVVPIEVRMKQFRNLLTEKNISVNSAWEEEFLQIVYDKRYLLLNKRERRHVFDEYVKGRAEGVRREQNRKVKEKALFRQLLEECNLNAKSTFNDFLKRCLKDKRFSVIDSMQDKKSMFLVYISELVEQEEKEKELMKEKVKNDFMIKLSEISVINNSTTWSDVKSKVNSDSYYEALFSDSHREDWFQEYLKNLNDVKNDFMIKLSEIPVIKSSTTWSDVKSEVNSDSCYEALFSDSHREDWFQEYLKNLNDVKNDFMIKLSEIPGINHSTTWSDVKSKVSSDSPYKALFSGPQGEDWFGEYLQTLIEDIKPKIDEDEAVCSYLGVDLKAQQDEQQTRILEQQSSQLQQHLQSLIIQNVQSEENFGSIPRILPNPWSHNANGANFPGSPMAGMTNSVGNAAGGSFNPHALGFGGMMQPFYTRGWATGLQGMEGFNQTFLPVIPGQPLIISQPMVPPIGIGGIVPAVASLPAFNSNASSSVFFLQPMPSRIGNHFCPQPSILCTNNFQYIYSPMP